MLTKNQKFYLFWKRLIDIFGSILGLIILGIPMLIIGFITKFTSRGPVFYKQERYGRKKKIFKILKFRSMKESAPEVSPSELNEFEQKTLVTKWGSFMRKTSLDELPQLINILKGDMSFIGPRPGAAHNEEHLVTFRESQDFNPFLVRPGLSGYAQMHMKRKHDPKEKAKQDSFYVQHISLWMDIKIFVYSILFGFGIVKGR